MSTHCVWFLLVPGLNLDTNALARFHVSIANIFTANWIPGLTAVLAVVAVVAFLVGLLVLSMGYHLFEARTSHTFAIVTKIHVFTVGTFKTEIREEVRIKYPQIT